MANHWIETAEKLKEAQKKASKKKSSKSFEERVKAIVEKKVKG